MGGSGAQGPMVRLSPSTPSAHPCAADGRSRTLTEHSFDDANGPARQESRSLMARQKA